jgi:hypothetical protein
MTLDQICNMTKSPTMLNALHACRPGHPLNNKFQWRDAWALAAQRPAYELDCAVTAWLAKQARHEANQEDQNK